MIPGYTFSKTAGPTYDGAAATRELYRNGGVPRHIPRSLDKRLLMPRPMVYNAKTGQFEPDMESVIAYNKELRKQDDQYRAQVAAEEQARRKRLETPPAVLRPIINTHRAVTPIVQNGIYTTGRLAKGFVQGVGDMAKSIVVKGADLKNRHFDMPKLEEQYFNTLKNTAGLNRVQAIKYLEKALNIEIPTNIAEGTAQYYKLKAFNNALDRYQKWRDNSVNGNNPLAIQQSMDKVRTNQHIHGHGNSIDKKYALKQKMNNIDAARGVEKTSAGTDAALSSIQDKVQKFNDLKIGKKYQYPGADKWLDWGNDVLNVGSSVYGRYVLSKYPLWIMADKVMPGTLLGSLPQFFSDLATGTAKLSGAAAYGYKQIPGYNENVYNKLNNISRDARKVDNVLTSVTHSTGKLAPLALLPFRPSWAAGLWTGANVKAPTYNIYGFSRFIPTDISGKEVLNIAYPFIQPYVDDAISTYGNMRNNIADDIIGKEHELMDQYEQATGQKIPQEVRRQIKQRTLDQYNKYVPEIKSPIK